MNYVLLLMNELLKEYKRSLMILYEQCKKKLEKILVNPRIEGAKLLPPIYDCCKIKLQSSGYRLVYQVTEDAKEV